VVVLSKGNSLCLLRSLAYVPLGLLTAPAELDPVKVDRNTGEWVFSVAVNTVAKNPQTGQKQAIYSLEFAASGDNVAFFASGWFAYLTLVLSAAPSSRRQAKRAYGTSATNLDQHPLSRRLRVPSRLRSCDQYGQLS
jgi:hypothetical protein